MAELTNNQVGRGQFWLMDAIVGAVVVLGCAALVLTRMADISMLDSAISSPTMPAATSGVPTTTDSDSTANWMSKAAVMAAVNQVPAPVGTGLPNVKAIQVEPNKIFTVLVRLEVDGIDNPAWDDLPVGEQHAYASDVAQSVRASMSELTLPPGHGIAYVRVGIWGWHRVSGAEEDFTERYCRTRALSQGADYWECYLPEVAAMEEV
ncbi:MAG TPA: hypothetical protein VGK54_17705 [Chloroflexota bacterium]|jgi:hypothetical protein